MAVIEDTDVLRIVSSFNHDARMGKFEHLTVMRTFAQGVTEYVAWYIMDNGEFVHARAEAPVLAILRVVREAEALHARACEANLRVDPLPIEPQESDDPFEGMF